MAAIVDARDLAIYDQVALNLALSRIQLVAPLSLLVFVGASILSATIASPTLAEISDEYLTILTPVSSMIGLYWLVLLVLLIGQCLLLSLTRTRETKETLVHGVGTRLALINVIMGFWVLFWTLKHFALAELTLVFALILAFSIWGTLLRYPISRSKPIDAIFIHAPTTMLLVILFSCDIWQNGLMALGYYRYVGALPNIPHGHWEADHTTHTWIAAGLVLIVGVINSTIVFIRTDFVWAAGSIYLAIALALKQEGKPAQVFVPLILSAVMVLTALVASIGWGIIGKKNDTIRLNSEESDVEREGLVRRSSRDD